MTSPPQLSVLLPTLNGRADLERLIPILREQELDGEALGERLEICAIDSESSDGTPEFLAAAGVSVERRPRAEFRHGRTRNRLAAGARGRFLVFLSQDAEPIGRDFLAGLLQSFDDERVAGTYCRILPHPDSDLLAARTVLALPEASEEPYVRDLDHCDGLWDMSPEERIRALRFNNVASAVRADVFARIPFPDVSFAEDFAWAARVLTAGHRLAYTPQCGAYHAHRYGPRTAFERYRIDAYFHRRAHGWRIRPSLLSVARGTAYEVRRDMSLAAERGFFRSIGDLARSPILRTAQVLGQYAGSRGWAPASKRPRPQVRDLRLLEP